MLIQPTNPVPHPRLGHVETLVVDSRKTACDGGLGALGHPRVFLTSGGHQTVCPYCSRLVFLQPGASDAHGPCCSLNMLHDDQGPTVEACSP